MKRLKDVLLWIAIVLAGLLMTGSGAWARVYACEGAERFVLCLFS